MASSEQARLSHVKVGENCDYVGKFCGSNSKEDAGEGVKRRRVSHDYRKQPKLGNGPSVSTETRIALSTETKGKKRKLSQDSQELCWLGENSTPAKLTKIWPVFDSGGYGDATILNLHIMKKAATIKNPLLYDPSESLRDFHADYFGGLQMTSRQMKLCNKIPDDEVTKRIFSSVSKQLRIINSHFQQSMFRYKYPRVTRSNVLLDSSTLRKPATHFSLTMKAIRFQSTQRRELPCYGNLELPLKVKQEGNTVPQFYPALGKSIQEEKPSEVKVKVENQRVEKERQREKEKEKEKERDKERDR